MDRLVVSGKSDLYGSVAIGGSKNSSLPILVATLLSKEDLKLKNLPNLDDVSNMKKLLTSFGTTINYDRGTAVLNSKNIRNLTTDYDIVRKMRASILIIGPLLSRFGNVKVSLPG